VPKRNTAAQIIQTEIDALRKTSERLTARVPKVKAAADKAAAAIVALDVEVKLVGAQISDRERALVALNRSTPAAPAEDAPSA